MSRLTVARALFALSLGAPMAGAQVAPPATASSPDTLVASPASDGILRPANDSLFRRARRLVSEGNGVAGRALVDSLLAAADPSTSAYGDALYWHGAIAPTAAAAEQDYRRVIVEYPLAYYSGDALLAIAELEQARGDRAGAMQHLQRFVREHPENPGRGIAALGVARLAFEQQDSTLACSMLVVARRSAAASDVELRNQIAYFGNRCASVGANVSASTTSTAPAAAAAPVAASVAASVATPVAAAASVSQAVPVPASPARRAPDVRSPVATPQPTRSPAARDAVKAPTRAAAKPGVTTKGSTEVSAKRASSVPRAETRPASRAGSRTATRYTVQVAAYPTRAEADALVKRLAARGIKARVSGSSKPFRVRLGLHAARKDATEEAASMHKRGMEAFVAEEEVRTGARTP